MSDSEIGKQSNSDFDLLCNFVKANNLEVVETVLKIKPDIDLDAHDSDNYTLCGLAALCNCPEIFEALCKAGANPDICSAYVVKNNPNFPRSMYGQTVWCEPVAIARHCLDLESYTHFQRIAEKYTKKQEKIQHSKATLAIYCIQKVLDRFDRFSIVDSKTSKGWVISPCLYKGAGSTRVSQPTWFEALQEYDCSMPSDVQFTESEVKAHQVAFDLINESIVLCGGKFCAKKNGSDWKIFAMGKERRVSFGSFLEAMRHIVDLETGVKVEQKKENFGQKYSKDTLAIHRIGNAIKENKENKEFSIKFGSDQKCVFNIGGQTYSGRDLYEALSAYDFTVPNKQFSTSEVEEHQLVCNFINRSIFCENRGGFSIVDRVVKGEPKIRFWLVNVFEKRRVSQKTTWIDAVKEIANQVLKEKEEDVNERNTKKDLKLPSNVENSTEVAIEKVLDACGRLQIKKKDNGTWTLVLGDYAITTLQSTRDKTWQEALCEFAPMLE